MPTLNWLTRDEDIRAASRVPYRLLEEVPGLSAGDPHSENILLQGDNLEALKALLPFYAGRVKCIYIDPPYNTGSAFEHYDDNLEHTQWLGMIWPRLVLLRDLLAEDGSIWINIDDNEAHYLKVAMDEVFGRKNFVANVVWQKRTSPDFRAALGDGHDNVLVAAKNGPLFGVLEERGFQVMLVDPRRIKNVPGRKTDVLDCQWLQQLHTYGLLSGAFRPDGEIRRLRSYLRQRAMLVEYAAQHIQRMQKALTQMNVKLHHVISDITGKTGMDIMEAIVGGQRDPQQLTQLRDPRIKADEATIAKSLQGHWREEHIFELTQALGLYRVYQDKIAQCDREIEAQLERFEDHSNGDPPAAKSGRRRSKGNAPRFDVWTHLYRMTGVGLTQIDGVDAYTALKVVSEIGTDMSKWPSAKHFASWLGLSPNNRVTGGRVMSSKTKPSANRTAAALRLAANALHRSDSALGAFLRRKKAQLGAPKAITATAHKLARLIYSMLRYGQEYVDAGAEYYESQYQQRALRAAQRRAA